MKIKIGEVPEGAEALLPENGDDASGVGVNYADAVLKAMKTRLADGRKVLARRRGLKIILTVGEVAGEGLLRRLEHGPEAGEILRRALMEAAQGAGVQIELVGREIFLRP